jgi:predicted aspartyl protease
MAQRVMDCGDAGHILLSKRVADDIAQVKHWRGRTYTTSASGKRISLVNLFTAEIGNSDRPTKECAPASSTDLPG